MFDPTKNDKPCCLMDPADLETLKNCGGPWEILSSYGEWTSMNGIPGWIDGYTYRQKLQPELWWVSSERVSDGVVSRAIVRCGGGSLSAVEAKSRGYRLMRDAE